MNNEPSIFQDKTFSAHVKPLTSKSGEHGRSREESATTTLLPSILVVDDDASVLAMLHDVLDLWGFDVFLASNGREGLDVLAKQTVNGILLDLDMPVMGGRTMLDELRWLGNRTPVVVMSGGLKRPALQQLVKEGAQAYMTKPFSLSYLKQLCATVFKNPGASTLSYESPPVA